ncbi:MAG: alpha/beta hydrolase [Eudoraea sp.]|nr:alpha/beta hydrolase [Eudoraea sp.]
MNINRNITLGSLEFDCRVAGSETDELVLFLHGFPETSIMWVPLLTDLASKGFYCVAPNMRGYSKNACPKGKKEYRIDKLGNDVLNMAKALGKEKFHLIAHDWGAVIGWHLAATQPKALISYTALSVPHLKAFFNALANDKDQQKRSKYIKMLVVPFVAEYSIRKDNFKLFRKLWKHSEAEEIEDYLTVFRNKKVLTAALNYYRANFGKAPVEDIGPIAIPTLFIWGNHDMAIGAHGVENGHGYMTGPYTFVELDAGHWLMQTKYTDMKPAILKHLKTFRSESQIQ